MNTFSDFKRDFYNRVDDLALFDCGDINLLKVVLDGLKVNYISKGKVKPYLFYPLFFHSFFSKIKANRYKEKFEDLIIELKKYDKRKYLISEVGRIVYDMDEKPRSLYFDNIIQILKRENVILVRENGDDKKLDFDCTLNDLSNAFMYLPFSKEEKILRSNLILTFNKIKKSTIFFKEELENIKFSFHKFFYQFKIWNAFLKELPNIETCYFVCHYHREGQIYALKKNKIKCIELQHGLIAPQDIFYVFPKKIHAIKQKALFADKILVYGNYWRNVLLKGEEYSDKDIDIVGYYLFNDFGKSLTERKALNDLVNEKKIILITTQTFLHKEFIELVKRLEENVDKNEVILLIKPHPAENPEIYKNAFFDSHITKVVSYNLPLLFEITSAHISIYSTTLYDAIRYNISNNYAYKVKGYEDYVNEIIESGVAKEISLGQNPLKKNLLKKNIDANYYYERIVVESILQKN